MANTIRAVEITRLFPKNTSNNPIIIANANAILTEMWISFIISIKDLFRVFEVDNALMLIYKMPIQNSKLQMSLYLG